MESSGLTPLIRICRYNSRYSGSENNAKRLKCLDLLVNYEGPDAQRLKSRWSEIWYNISPFSIREVAWGHIADYCIPNINVRPEFRGKNATDFLRSYENPREFDIEGLNLIEHLYAATCNDTEKYWPKTREEYKTLFNPAR